MLLTKIRVEPGCDAALHSRVIGPSPRSNFNPSMTLNLATAVAQRITVALALVLALDLALDQL